MKNISRLFSLLILGTAILATGCIESDAPALSLSDVMFRIGAEGGDHELRVGSNTDWEVVAGYPEWITLSAVEGRGSRTIQVYVDPYEDLISTGREGTVTFQTTGTALETATLVITQGKYASELAVSPGEYTVNANGGRVFFVVTSNTEWKLIGDYDWVDARIEGTTADTSAGDKVVTLIVDGFDSHESSRQAHFVVTNVTANGKIAETFTLTQTGLPDPSLILGESEIDFPSTLRTSTIPHKVPIITNVSISEPTVAGSPWWCTATVLRNGGIWYVELTPQYNPDPRSRSGVITVYIPDVDDLGSVVTEQIKVTQDGAGAPILEILSPIVNIPASLQGGDVTKTISYISNGSIELFEWPEWVISAQVDNTVVRAGDQVGTITFIAEPNLDITPRTGTIAVVATSDTQRVIRSVTIIQQALREFTVDMSQSTIKLPARRTTPDEQMFTIVANASVGGVGSPVIMQTDGDWLTENSITSESTGTGTRFTIKMAYTSNREPSVRIGTVQMFWTAGSQSYTTTLNVTQDAVSSAFIDVSEAPYRTGTSADVLSVPAVASSGSNVEVVSYTPEAMFAAAPVLDNPDALTNVEVSITENTDTAARTGEVVLLVTNGDDSQYYTITIEQESVTEPTARFGRP